MIWPRICVAFYCHHKSHSLQSGFDNGLYPTRDNLTDIPFNG
nr:MAG TPA: hypothetical protein [Caudoviricetes sp.]